MYIRAIREDPDFFKSLENIKIRTRPGSPGSVGVLDLTSQKKSIDHRVTRKAYGRIHAGEGIIQRSVFVVSHDQTSPFHDRDNHADNKRPDHQGKSSSEKCLFSSINARMFIESHISTPQRPVKGDLYGEVRRRREEMMGTIEYISKIS